MSNTNAADTDMSASSTESKAEETAITTTMGDTVIPAVLNNSVSAQDFISNMPFTVSMTRGSADFYWRTCLE